MSPIAELDRVTKTYRLGNERSNWRSLIPGPLGELGDVETFDALHEVSLEIAEGLLGVVGRNGAGKSTMLMLLAGVIRPTSGEVHVRGRVAPVIELGVGFDPELTGAENVRFAGALLGHRPGDLAARYDEIVEFSGLGDFMGMPLRRYSTGMRARLGFSLVTAFESELLLLDEVLSVGDWEFQQRCSARVRELHEGGTAIVAVSHSNWLLTQLCEELVLIDHGEVVLRGEPIEVISAYLGSETIGVGEPIPEDQIVAPLITAPEEPGQVRVLDLRCTPPDIEPGEPLGFRFRLEVDRPVDAQLVFSVYTMGRAAFAEPEVGPADLLAQVGASEVEVRIPTFPIAPGRYHLQVAVIEQHLADDHHQEYHQALAKAMVPFSVLGDPTARPGLKLAAEWHAQPEPAS
ncbi:MAG: polysaccharide ABC transporter ATP-binding protein [Acidimicrobiales bacterium]